MFQQMQVQRYEEMIKRAKLSGHSEGSIKALEAQLAVWQKALEGNQKR